MYSFEISKFTVFPAFSSPVSTTFLTADLTAVKTQIKNSEFYINQASGTNFNGTIPAYSTTDRKILKQFPDLENSILDNFDDYIQNVLRISNKKFIITTSWGTKVKRGGESQFHSHKNSFYSGVLYFDEIIDGGILEFGNHNLSLSNFLLGGIEEYNLLNTEGFTISPRKNMLVFFPSYLFHRITRHNSNLTRYSLAFNLHPIGEYGLGDSFINNNAG
jgi:hypothetical protein